MSDTTMFDLPADAGMEEFDATDLIIPRRQYVQPTSNIKGMPNALPGTFIDIDSKQQLAAEMEIVILEINKTRVLFWDQKRDNKVGLRCKSNDAIVPVILRDKDDNPIRPVADMCEDCEFKDDDLVYELLCLDAKMTRETGDPVLFWMGAKGTSRKTVQQYVSMMRQLKKALASYTIKVTCPRTPGRSYVILNFSDYAVVGDDLKPIVYQAYQTYAGGKAKAASETAADEASESTAAAPTGGRF